MSDPGQAGRALWLRTGRGEGDLFSLGSMTSLLVDFSYSLSLRLFNFIMKVLRQGTCTSPKQNRQSPSLCGDLVKKGQLKLPGGPMDSKTRGLFFLFSCFEIFFFCFFYHEGVAIR